VFSLICYVDEQEQAKKVTISSYKLNEIFGYVTKTLFSNMYEVLEPKASAINLIYKGLLKKKQQESSFSAD